VRANYVFVGWLHADGRISDRDRVAGFVLNNSATLTAQWTPVLHTLTYNLNGGNVNESTANVSFNIPHGSLIGLSRVPADPVRANHTFDGWRHADGRISDRDRVAGFRLNNPATLTAQWTAVTRTLAFNAGTGGTLVSIPPGWTGAVGGTQLIRIVDAGTAWNTITWPTAANFSRVNHIPTIPARPTGNVPAIGGTVSWTVGWRLNPPTITSPRSNGQQVPRDDLTVRWTAVSGATYRITVRNLATNIAVIDNRLVSGTSFTIPGRQLLEWNSYRITVSATVGTQASSAERTFSVLGPVVMSYDIFMNAGFSTAARAQGYVDASKAAFWNEFAIILARQNTTATTALNQRPGCTRLFRYGCDSGCAPVNRCRQEHHRSGGHFLTVRPGTRSRSSFKFVDYRICSYRGGGVHWDVNGLANRVLGDTIIVTVFSDNPRRTTAHEISHLFGATDGGCSSSRCVMFPGAPYFDQWCDVHRNQILANRHR